MDLKDLSSNWKKLQQKIKEEEAAKPVPASSPSTLKRKHSAEETLSNGTKKSKSTKALKRKRSEGGNSVTPHTNGFTKPKKVKMQNGTPTPRIPETPIAAITNDFVSPADILKAASVQPFTPNLGFYPASESSKVRYVALDCEMVGTGPPPYKDSQLARVSMTNYKGEVLYDSYVQPVMEVTDYRTFVSGIRPEHLLPSIARPFRDVQAAVQGLLDGRILVGHALHHDLAALLLSHAARDIRDTSRYSKYKALAGGRTPGLKKLTKELLGIEIQTGEHSSVEDARASMALYIREKDGFERAVLKQFGKPKVFVMKKEELEEEEELRKERAEKRKARLLKKKKKKKGKK